MSHTNKISDNETSLSMRKRKEDVHSSFSQPHRSAVVYRSPTKPETTNKVQKNEVAVDSKSTVTQHTEDLTTIEMGEKRKNKRKMLLMDTECMTEPGAATATTSLGVITSAVVPVKKVKVNSNTSVQRAAAAVNVELKRTARHVLMEDDNVTVQQEVYTVTYKNADEVYKTVTTRVQKIFDDAVTNLNRTVEKQLNTFKNNAERLIDQHMNRIRRAVNEPVKDTDTHTFVFIVEKQSQPHTFHMTTAFDRKDLTKKTNRWKNADKLILEFYKEKDFNISRLKDLLRDCKMLKTRSKMDFTYTGGDLKSLHQELIKVINGSPVYRGAYRLTYMRASLEDNGTDRAQTTKTKRANKNVVSRKKTNDIRRSLNEEDTDYDSIEDDESEFEKEEDEDEEEEYEQGEDADGDLMEIDEGEEEDGKSKGYGLDGQCAPIGLESEQSKKKRMKTSRFVAEKKISGHSSFPETKYKKNTEDDRQYNGRFSDDGEDY